MLCQKKDILPQISKCNFILPLLVLSAFNSHYGSPALLSQTHSRRKEKETSRLCCNTFSGSQISIQFPWRSYCLHVSFIADWSKLVTGICGKSLLTEAVWDCSSVLDSVTLIPRQNYMSDQQHCQGQKQQILDVAFLMLPFQLLISWVMQDSKIQQQAKSCAEI